MASVEEACMQSDEGFPLSDNDALTLSVTLMRLDDYYGEKQSDDQLLKRSKKLLDQKSEPFMDLSNGKLSSRRQTRPQLGKRRSHRLRRCTRKFS